MSQTPAQPFSPPPFLDVATLLQTSRPARRINLLWPLISVMGLIVLLQLSGRSDQNAHRMTELLSGCLIMLLIVVSAGISVSTIRSFRQQQQTVEAIEEMMQLRRWEPAGIMLDRLLSVPVRSPRLWATALVRLAELLGRHHRFEDALIVQSFLIDNELLDEPSEYFLRLSRTMAMLREDHLVDADRAISDLRRRGPRDAGGLALVEMFRDVKTGHPDEAIEIFNKSLPAMRQQLGHRVADAHALIAQAYDQLGDEAQAKAAFERATLLAPLAELQRRYPELLKLAEKFPASPAPQEVA